MNEISLVLRNAQRKIKVDARALARFGRKALSATLPWRRAGADIWQIEAISVLIVSDARIARAHRQFSNLPAPTDVLTFQHGDIMISAETARRQGRTLGKSTDAELRLYLVHALLHLCGFDDHSAKGRAGMRRMESRVLSACAADGV